MVGRQYIYLISIGFGGPSGSLSEIGLSTVRGLGLYDLQGLGLHNLQRLTQGTWYSLPDCMAVRSS